jgi:hypothetical protein
MASIVVESLSPTGALVAYLDADGDLTTLAPIGVWAEPLPQEAIAVIDANPGQVYVTVLSQSPRLQPCGGGDRWVDGLWAIKAVGPADRLRDIEAAALQIDTLLRRSTAEGRVLEGWHVMGLRAESLIEYPDPGLDAGGVRYEHRGAQYRLMAEVAT